jgi:hypothetical protein
MCVCVWSFTTDLKDDLKEHSPPRKPTVAQLLRKLPAWNKFTTCSQHLATGSYSESDKSGSTCCHIIGYFHPSMSMLLAKLYTNYIFYDKAAEAWC